MYHVKQGANTAEYNNVFVFQVFLLIRLQQRTVALGKKVPRVVIAKVHLAFSKTQPFACVGLQATVIRTVQSSLPSAQTETVMINVT